MPNDAPIRALTAYETLRRQLEPLSAQIEALQSNTGIYRPIEEAARNRTLMRAALGPAEDLRRSVQRITELTRLAGGSQAGRPLLSAPTEWSEFLRLGAKLEKQFVLPETHDIPKLLEALKMDGLEALKIDGTAIALAHYRDHASQCRHAIEAMTTPWLNQQNQLRSISGFLGLQHIGHELLTKPIFDVESAERLRHYLGDWRARVDWPSTIFTDARDRSEFYLERGLDPDLTDFPAIAFDQAITSAGVKRAPPPYIRAYADTDDKQGEQNAGFERNNAAHDRLQRFESQIRVFIDQRMTATVGENWIKHRVSGMRKQWKEKQTNALDRGEARQPLIAYADFTDYLKIIKRKDNWEQVFVSVFQRKSSVQESLQRLYPIRICTMHARIITQDDELYLHAETKRLLIAMGIET